MKKLTYFLLLFILSSCGTSTIMVNVQKPADITVSNNIKNIVLANRTTPSKSNLANNILEGITSGENIGADRNGANYCMKGIINLLSQNERYNLSSNVELELKGTGTSQFPLPLSPKKINKLSKPYNADAIVVLETFDSDSRVFEGKPIEKVKKVKGVKIKELSYPATLIIDIESGWRIYDVENELIVDENKYKEIKEFKVWGSSPKEAKMKLPSKSAAIKEAGFFAGEQYAQRISPIWITVNRSYYSGKDESLKKAKEYVKINEWEQAIQIWKNLSQSNDQKLSSQACFNMALASEVNGSIDTALSWARKALSKGDKRASSYINTLKRRKIDQIKLNNQLNN